MRVEVEILAAVRRGTVETLAAKMLASEILASVAVASEVRAMLPMWQPTPVKIR